ncbi:MAG: methyltransferase domain-containing protein, partial [Candidatus Thorarchaeota archaeon]
VEGVRYNTRGYDVNKYSDFNDTIVIARANVLTMFDVIEHMEYPEWVIDEVRPEVVFITTPNAANAQWDKMENFRHFKPGEHIRLYTPVTLANWLMDLGYTPILVNYDEGRLRNPSCPEDIFTMVGVKNG